MSTSHIVDLLVAERSRLQAAIDALKGAPEHGLPDWVQGKKAPQQAAQRTSLSRSEQMKENWRKRKAQAANAVVTPGQPKKKHKLSAEVRKRMAEGQRKRWEKLNAAKTEAASPRKTNSVKIAEAIAPTKEDAEFKSKMSIAMAKSWAKRKKAAKRKAK